jgi:hypothetical protein
MEEEVMKGEHEKCGNENVGIAFDIRENDQQDAHLFSLIYSNQSILYILKQIIVHHQEFTSVHTAYIILPC